VRVGVIALVDIQDGIIEYAGKVYIEVPDGMSVVFAPEEDMAEFRQMCGVFDGGATD